MNEKITIIKSSGCYVTLDAISKKVAEKLSGKAIQDVVKRESKIFSSNKLQRAK